MTASGPSTSAEESAPTSIDLLWDEGQRRLVAQSERLSRLDSKTTPLLAFGIAAAAFFQANAQQLGTGPARFGTALAALGILFTFAAMYPRTHSYAPSYDAFVRAGHRESTKLKTRYLGNVRTAIRENDSQFEAKTSWFKATVWVYVATIATAVGAILAAHG